MAYPGARGFEAILSEGGTVSDENILRQDAAEGFIRGLVGARGACKNRHRSLTFNSAPKVGNDSISAIMGY